VKQQILDLRSEAERQERLLGHLGGRAPQQQRAQALRERSGGNGHGLD
jgi:hypothetical protein